MADMQAFEYLCRICASDTKGKSSVAECVFILKTVSLKDKIKKYLDLTVSEDDALPKVICKSCYRSVEGIVSLSKIAVHTQMVLNNFLKPHAALIEPDSEFTSIATPVKDFNRVTGGEAALLQPLQPQQQLRTAPKEKQKRAEEVVVNVSVSDPLTRETQQKIIGASRQRQNMLDTRFIPKSIAHRHVSFATSTPKEHVTEPANHNLAKKNTVTPPATPGVINFYNSQQPQQQVTVTSGGYVIGQTTPHNTPVSNSSSSSSVKPQGNQDNEQKRKNLKMTLKQIRANNAGQVSLLKVSQKPSQLTVNPTLSNTSFESALESQQQPNSLPPVFGGRQRAASPLPSRRQRKPPQRRPTIAEIPSTVEALPREIIIASVKKPRTNTSANMTPKQAQPPPNITPPQSSPEAVEQTALPKSLFPDDIPLGRVIRDFDLLKLIMKALKWPFNRDNIESQMERLRNSKFTTIMSDQNLLQDTDLTQLLGPYLAPVLMAAQVLQQQQNVASAASMVSPPKTSMQKTVSPAETPTDLSATAPNDLTRAMPYRLPPETSVQLVPASPEEEQPSKPSNHTSRKAALPTKKIRRPAESPKSRDLSIVISDGEEDSSSHSGSKRKEKEKPLKLKPTNDSYDALKQLAERSRAALERVTSPAIDPKSMLPPTGHYPNFVDDIVLMEPESPKPIRRVKSPQSKVSMPSVISMSSPDNLFQARAVPPITRPIIKRRKTVIHASPVKALVMVNSDNKPQQSLKNDTVENEPPPLVSQKSDMSDITVQDSAAIQVPSTSMIEPKKPVSPSPNKISVATSMSFFGGVTTHITGVQETPTVSTTPAPHVDEIADEVAPATAVTENIVKENKEPVKKPLSSKAGLAEQLLEAVGLKKSNEPTLEKAPSRESVQQIRSALKRSLKQAVEQNQRKQEPVKQDADSTTKSVTKNLKPVDIGDMEDEMAKATLQKTDKQMSLLRARSHDSATRPRSLNRLPRKTATQTSVIKKPTTSVETETNETKPPVMDIKIPEIKSSIELLIESNSSGNAVSSTSEPRVTVTDFNKKRGRKRKGPDDNTGDAMDAVELENKKKEIKTELDTEAVGDGGNELLKDDIDKKSESGGSSSTRPSRASKTSSKYYKGPEKHVSTRPTRSTRNK